MVQQIHLHDGVFCGHGLDIQLLDTDNAQFFFCNFGLGQFDKSHGHGLGEGILTHLLGKSGLILADLTLDALDNTVDSLEHIISLLFRTEEEASVVDGQLYCMFAAMEAVCNLSVGIFAEILIELFTLLDDIFLAIVIDLSFSFVKLYVHSVLLSCETGS